MKQFIKLKYGLFLMALLQTMFISMNIIFITERLIIPMLMTGFIISILWSFNVKRVAFGGWTDRLVYASGAVTGTAVGYLLSTFATKLI